MNIKRQLSEIYMWEDDVEEYYILTDQFTITYTFYM